MTACFVVDSSVLPGAYRPTFSRDGVFHAQPNMLTGARASNHNEAIDSPVAQPQTPGDNCDETPTADDECILWEFGQLPSAELALANERKVSSSRVIRVADVRSSSLQCIDIIVEGMRCIALLNSGSQIPLISDVLFQRLNFDDCGHINVRGMFSKPICVPLADVIMKHVGGRDHDDVAEGLPVMCAVVSLKDVKYDIVLPPDIVANFNLMPVTDVTSERVNDNHVNVDDQTNDMHECVTSVMNVVDDDVSAGEPSSMTVSNDIKDEVDNVVQLLPSDEGRVESDVRPDVVHTVDDVVTGGVTCDDDAGRGDYDAGGGDCVAVTNCGDVIHAQNNLVELLFIVLLLLLKFTGRAVCDLSYHPPSIIDVMAACSVLAVITSELFYRLLYETVPLTLYHLHSMRRDTESKQSICDKLLLIMEHPIIDWRSWSFGRGPISWTKARHYDDDSRTCHLEYDVMKSRRSVHERTHWFVIVSTIVIVLLALVSDLLNLLFCCLCVFRYMNFTLQPFRRYVPHFRMSDLVRNGDCVLYQV